MGIVPSQSGTVHIKGQSMHAHPAFDGPHRSIGYVPEGRGIFGKLGVTENVKRAARAGSSSQRDWTYQRVRQTVPRLQERLDHGGQQLSGYEQQVPTIGRALMTNPDVLILDGATEGPAHFSPAKSGAVSPSSNLAASAPSSWTKTGNTRPRPPTAT